VAQYGTIITNIGLAQIANAQITQTKVGLEYIALGDGNGAHYVPTQNQTKLVHEVWRGPIAELSIDPTNSNRIIIDAVIPVTAGGFTIREIGIFDDKNNLIAVGQYPEKYKPQLSEGVSEETLIHFVIETNNADVVKLTIDPTVIIASRNYVDGKVAQVQTALTEHSEEIATTEKLGHIKPDGTTITVDPETGIASAVSNNEVIPFTGDLNDLVSNGLYSVVSPTNVPQGFYGRALVQVIVSDQDVVQIFMYTNSAAAGGVLSRAKSNNVWGSWTRMDTRLSDSLTNPSTIEAATANAVKQVNDKIAPTPFGLTPNAPFVIDDSSGLTVGKSGNVAVLSFRVKPSQQLATTSQYQLCEILPVGYRNLRATVVGHGFCWVSSVARLIPVTIASGTVIMQAPPVAIPANTYIDGNITFYVG